MTTFRSLCNTQSLFAGLVNKFAEHCWYEGWKIGKQKEREVYGIFQGAPPVGTIVRCSDGTEKVVDAYTRLRLNQIDPCEYERLGISVEGIAKLRAQKPDANPDVFHPEFVATYEDLVKLSLPQNNFVANNGVGAASTILFLADEVADDDMTVEEMADQIDMILSGNDQEAAYRLNMAVHAGWVARAVCDLSFMANRDFTPSFALIKVTSEIDAYVVCPVLKALRDHLRSL